MVNTSAQELLSSGVAAVLRTVEKVGKSKRSAHTSANGRKPFYSIKKNVLFSRELPLEHLWIVYVNELAVAEVNVDGKLGDWM